VSSPSSGGLWRSGCTSAMGSTRQRLAQGGRPMVNAAVAYADGRQRGWPR
jgi:hypothetical protein